MDIDKLVKGDSLVVETAFAYILYKHINTVIVSPNDASVISDMPTKFKGDKGTALLTLTSCHPKYDDAKRIVAFNAYVGSYSKKDYNLEEVLKIK
jgi:sortase A